MKPVVVVGSINMDLVSSAPRIPVAGETLIGSSFQMHPGGKGANQAVAVARLGHAVEMIGRLGSDPFGERLRLQLQGAGVGVAGVDTVPGPSGIAAITVSPTGENSIVVTPGANGLLSPEYIERHHGLIRGAGIVLTQLEIPIASVERLVTLCHNDGVPLILDPAPAQALPPHLMKRIGWFTPNETEAAFYSRRGAELNCSHEFDSRALHETAMAILAEGPRGVILKLGCRGAYLASDGDEVSVTAKTVKAVDTTAAGDALNGAFAVGLMLGKAPVESARFAVAAASVSVTRAGAQPSMPTMAEVEALGGS